MFYINSPGSSLGLRLCYRFRYRPLDTLSSWVFTHCLCFSFQEFAFSVCHFSVSFSEIASEFTIGAYDPMAGDFGGEGVFLQGLANGLRASAAYAVGKFAVGYGLPGRDCQEFQIDFLLELGDFFAGYDSVAEGWHGFVWSWGEGYGY